MLTIGHASEHTVANSYNHQALPLLLLLLGVLTRLATRALLRTGVVSFFVAAPFFDPENELPFWSGVRLTGLCKDNENEKFAYERSS